MPYSKRLSNIPSTETNWSRGRLESSSPWKPQAFNSFSSTLKAELYGSPKHWYPNTRCHNPDNHDLNLHRRENLKSLWRVEFVNVKMAFFPAWCIINLSYIKYWTKERSSFLLIMWDPETLKIFFEHYTCHPCARTPSWRFRRAWRYISSALDGDVWSTLRSWRLTSG